MYETFEALWQELSTDRSQLEIGRLEYWSIILKVNYR